MSVKIRIQRASLRVLKQHHKKIEERPNINPTENAGPLRFPFDDCGGDETNNDRHPEKEARVCRIDRDFVGPTVASNDHKGQRDHETGELNHGIECRSNELSARSFLRELVLIRSASRAAFVHFFCLAHWRFLSCRQDRGSILQGSIACSQSRKKTPHVRANEHCSQSISGDLRTTSGLVAQCPLNADTGTVAVDTTGTHHRRDLAVIGWNGKAPIGATTSSSIARRRLSMNSASSSSTAR
jgi:hypothetical protein